ncbi:mg2+ transporter protein [Moniliophthora roreri MCA 2997]|uniref:Mg2+ transporter protein n=2 Tax=Moniliophthora roreri TaxID=221103 RepID=V2XAM9_MONRO|nr:mg2+ transporter protein [Moniliophthora roreri MCA 2997]
MLTTTIFNALLGASFALAAPVCRRVTINQEAAAEAQQRDDTATRAFTAAEIKTANGQCLSVDPNTGDFRLNLIPIQIKACDGSPNQQWDVITAGKHNDQPGNALIVSSLINGCLNFDPRRAAGNQVILFSCGGRADGEGQVTDSQLFPFDGNAGPLPLVPKNSQNKVCLTANGDLLDQAACNPDAAADNQLFTIGEGGQASPPATAAPTEVASTASASASTVPTTAGTAPQATGTAVLDPAAVAEAQQRDDTATRAFTASEIKTSDGQCLSVDPLSGDFRQNLIPVQIQTCNGSPNQQWDVITAGKHNNQPGNALIVSSLINGCLNFDDRRAPGNQVILFSCGGRADGEGEVTDSQLFPFDGNAGPLALTPKNSRNTVCLTVKGNLLDQEACNPDAAADNQLFTIGEGGQASPPPATASPTEVISTASASATAVQPPTTIVAAPRPTGTAVLNPEAVAEAQQRDDTATRAFSDVQVKTADGQCLSVDPLGGDFRQNLIPVTVGACDGSPNQKFDVITKGKHNNVDGTALVVSSLIQGCLNFDPRRPAGNQVILFSCGGRADGGGLTTDSQLFPFPAGTTGPIPLTPVNSKNTQCMVNKNGNLDVTQCNGSNPNADQLFSFVA